MNCLSPSTAIRKRAALCFFAIGLTSCLFTIIPVGAQDAPSTRSSADAAFVPTPPPLTPPLQGRSPDGPGIEKEKEPWREDPARVSRGLEDQLTPEEYQRALRTTGMMNHLQIPVLPGLNRAPAAGTWNRMGPVGGFGSPAKNGRIAGVQLMPGGGLYKIYAGACQGGLWQTSVLNWAQWTDLSPTLQNPSVRAIAVDPSDHQRIFVGTGDWNRYAGAGMFVTDDGGASWSAVALPDTPEAFFRILYLNTPTDPPYSDMITASSRGLFRSNDRGATWSYAQFAGGGDANGAWTDIVLHPTSPDTLYACRLLSVSGVGRGVYRSTDAGSSWEQLTDPDLPVGPNWDRASMAICRDDPRVLAVLVENDGYLQGVFKTTDSGNSWMDITSGLTDPEIEFGSNQVGHAQAIAIRPTDPDEIIIGAVDVARSYNGGLVWYLGSASQIEKGHSDITQLHFSPLSGDDVLWICNDGGIYWYSYTDGLTRDIIGDASTGLACSEIDFMDADRQIRGIGMQDNGTLLSTDGGLNWFDYGSGDGGDIEIADPEAGDVWFNSGVFPAPDVWQTFRKRINGPFNFTYNPSTYMPRIFRHPGSDRMYTTDTTAVYSTPEDGNFSWSLEVGNLQPGQYNIRSLWGSRAGDLAIYLTYWGINQRDLTILRNDGVSWDTRHLENFNPVDKPVEWVYPSREWPGECWVGLVGNPGDTKILHTTNDGVTWTDITGNLADLKTVNTIEVMPFNPLEIFVGTEIGVFHTTNGGQTWQPFQDGLPVGRCKELRLVLDDNLTSNHSLVLAVDGRGLWSRNITAPAVIYVDKRNTGTEDGSFEHPFNTVTEGIAAAPAGGIVAAHTDTYAEPQVVAGSVLLIAWGGGSAIVD